MNAEKLERPMPACVSRLDPSPRRFLKPRPRVSIVREECEIRAHVSRRSRQEIVFTFDEKPFIVVPRRRDERDPRSHGLEHSDRGNSDELARINPARNVHRDSMFEKYTRHIDVGEKPMISRFRAR